MNTVVFWKTVENVWKQRDIKLVTTKKNKKLFSIRTRLLYYKVFQRGAVSNRNEKKELMNKPVYLGFLTL